MGAKLKQLLADYGAVALWIYFTLFLGVFVGIYVAILAGWTPKGVAGSAGALALAWVATKLTQPLRIGATLALTPLVAKLWRRRAAKSGPDAIADQGPLRPQD